MSSSAASVLEPPPVPVISSSLQSATGVWIGKAVKSLRKEKGLSQEELARQSKLDRTTIVRLECGYFKSLSLDKLENIASALDMSFKSLLLKADAVKNVSAVRSDTNRIYFLLDYPDLGFRILSITPKQKEVFFGRIEVLPQKMIDSLHLPHPEHVYLHLFEGKMLLTFDGREHLLKTGDCFAFPGQREFEIYNPEPLKTTSALFITYPSFVTC